MTSGLLGSLSFVPLSVLTSFAGVRYVCRSLIFFGVSEGDVVIGLIGVAGFLEDLVVLDNFVGVEPLPALGVRICRGFLAPLVRPAKARIENQIQYDVKERATYAGSQNSGSLLIISG